VNDHEQVLCGRGLGRRIDEPEAIGIRRRQRRRRPLRSPARPALLAANSAPDYREKLDAELKEMADSEMWRTGAAVRSLRPENWKQ
jgi:hypothetical protein